MIAALRLARACAWGLFLAAILAAPSLAAQNGPRLSLQLPAVPPSAGSLWSLTLLSDHGDPAQIDIVEPDFPAGVALVEIARGPRWVAAPSGAFELWTAIEYRFVFAAAGVFSFDSFVARTPLGQTESGPFVVEALSAPGAARVALASWSAIPEGLRVGESAVFYLRFDGREGALPEPAFFMPAVPPGHFLEALPLSPSDAARGIALSLRLTALEPGVFELAPRLLSQGGAGEASFGIPGLLVHVGESLAGPVAAQPVSPAMPAQTQPISPDFPPAEIARAINARLYDRQLAEIDRVHSAARHLWEGDNFAGALALLRQNEREHRAGALFAEIRRRAEQSLGLVPQGDERRRIFIGRFALPFFRRGPPGAVLLETAARRVPDESGEEIAFFAEGRRVRVAEIRADGDGQRWARVAAADGFVGWIPEERLIRF